MSSSVRGVRSPAFFPRNLRSIARGRGPSPLREFLRLEECEPIVDALDEIELRTQTDLAWLDSSTAEDVHHFVETALIEKLGPLGAKLHTGRSRNEMVATEFRMYVKRGVPRNGTAVASLESAFADQAEKNLCVPMPGTTHMQHAQPFCFRTGCWRMAKLSS